MNIGGINIEYGKIGNTALSVASAGLVRIPGLAFNAAAALVVGEVALRGLTGLMSLFGWKTVNDQTRFTTWMRSLGEKEVEKKFFDEKTKKDVTITLKEGYFPNFSLRPMQETSWTTLTVQFVAFAILGIAFTEFANAAFGPAPEIYNNVLSFIGPIRVDSTSWFQNVGIIA